QMALGAVVMQRGSARLSTLRGLSQTMPMSTGYLLLGGLPAAALPGAGLYVSHTVALAASMHWEDRVLWTAISGLSAVMMATVALRFSLAAFFPAARHAPRNEAPFVMQLAAALAAFFCIAVGFNPTWLYNLLPSNNPLPASGLSFAPFTLD